jgi:proteic killer suppression protein
MVWKKLMIKSFKHKGLEVFYKTGNTKGIQSVHARKLKLILGVLNAACEIRDIQSVSAFKFHSLSGNRKSQHSVTVNKNWRVTFEFDGADVRLTNYEDYH